ncbi:MAG: hypothetical protein QFX34_03005 [Candidatus Verstraetearchaeota archaeon]|nr:hypothetical protein [Candidatus Verstraetearchaeota archaeon]
MSVSNGILSFRGSGVPGGYPMSTTSNVLGKPITRYAHVRYTLTAPHAGAFYFEAKVADMQISSLPCSFYVGVAVYDTQGNAVAYCSAYAQMSSSSNSTTFYVGVQDAGPNGNTYAWSDAVTGYTLSIRRTASGAWQINLYARDPANMWRSYSAAFYPGGGYSGEIGGILIHTTTLTGGVARAYWDYARTDLPVSVARGALCGEVPACASASGTFYANTTAEFAALPSGAALVTISQRPDSGGLKVTGVGEGDIVTLFRTDGSSAFNATVPAGASELTVTGVQLPFTGTIVVAGRQSARAVAQYSGALASGDTLTLSFSNQTGSYSLSKTASGGGFTGALVTGLQPGWKVAVTNGTKTYTYYANGSGAALMGTLPPGTTKTVLVYKPTVCIANASFSGGGKYALVEEMEFPAFATASDTVFYEVSTAGYTYRVEAKVISIDVVGATSAGSFAEIKFSYKVYENGSLKPDASPILSFWGILAATQRLSNHTYTSIFSLNNCEDGILMAFEDPISGIVIKGRVLV